MSGGVAWLPAGRPVPCAKPVGSFVGRTLREPRHPAPWRSQASRPMCSCPGTWSRRWGSARWLGGRLSFRQGGCGIGARAFGGWWLLPLALPILPALRLAFLARPDERGGTWLAACGFAGFAYLLVQGFAVGLKGWGAEWLAAVFGGPGPAQQGMGVGALVVACALLLMGCRGLAIRGWCRGDAFVVSSVGDRDGADRSLCILSSDENPASAPSPTMTATRRPRSSTRRSPTARSGALAVSGAASPAASPGTPSFWPCLSVSSRRRLALPSRLSRRAPRFASRRSCER